MELLEQYDIVKDSGSRKRGKGTAAGDESGAAEVVALGTSYKSGEAVEGYDADEFDDDEDEVDL